MFPNLIQIWVENGRINNIWKQTWLKTKYYKTEWNLSNIFISDVIPVTFTDIIIFLSSMENCTFPYEIADEYIKDVFLAI